MNEPDPNESLSAFVDGELRGPARARVVAALYGSAERRRAWERFHLIGDAVRKTGPVPGAGAIAEGVGAVLSDERIVRFGPRPRRPRHRMLAGLAIAATVASIAILGIHHFDDGDARSIRVAGRVAGDPQPELVVADAASATVDFPVSPVVSTAAQAAGAGPDRLRWREVAPDAEARLHVYLVNHNAQAGNGMLPYVRIVGYQYPVEGPP